MTGAAVSTLGDVLATETLAATDSQAARLDEVQFDLGEGPCWDAVRSGRSVVEPEVADSGMTRWPAFSAAIRDDGVCSIFAFPLMVGPLRLGAVDLYSLDSVTLDGRQVRQASAMADVIGRNVLRQALRSLEDLQPVADAHSRRAIQATGVVLAQLNVSAEDAHLVLQGHAFATGRSMMDVSKDVLDRTLAFHYVGDRIEVTS
ncbi:GAF and ANTAR domain-containing protein [Microbacterium mangrovi]|uniref:GAF and ANTAR domain-containing protein n=1 Tax=Microbacterium mangrovi TaxID=1348253 RepID=UPI00068D50B1|nr:GAF and ANTAR domain-containing protein [Microbacterium mangrovi]